MLLSTKYRPKSFEDVVGQRATVLVLKKMVELNKVPSGLLFYGVRGTGKTSLARIMVSDKDMIEVDGANCGVAEIREIINSLMYVSEHRTVIIDECHALSSESFKALLKPLEEPHENVTFILVTTEYHKIPETIKSRLVSFEFTEVSDKDIVPRLEFICEQESIVVEYELLTTIAERSYGDVRSAIMKLDQVARIGIESALEYTLLFEVPDFGSELLSLMVSGDVSSVFDFVELQLSRFGSVQVIVDELVGALTAGLRASVERAPSSPALGGSQGFSEPDRAFGALRLLWSLGTQTSVSKSPKTMLDIALVLCTEVLSGKLHKKLEAKKLSLEEMNS